MHTPTVNLIQPIALLLLALGAAGCRQVAAPEGSLEWVETRLVFGMNLAGSPGVTEADWQKFLAEEVTPRFPDGLTVIHSEGQWKGSADQPIEREESRILEVDDLQERGDAHPQIEPHSEGGTSYDMTELVSPVVAYHFQLISGAWVPVPWCPKTRTALKPPRF